MRRLFAFLFAIAFFFASAKVSACLWDYDTLAMERQRFPETIELITGKFLRHGPQFYRWRVKDRTARIADAPTSTALYDDLAVAYEKLGDHDKAIETILKKESFAPGLYETYANLGTFYIHSGKLQEGVEQIDRAIQINPDAHFGREIYQKLLVKYVLSNQKDGKTILPLYFIPKVQDPKDGDRMIRIDYRVPQGFAGYVLEERGLGDSKAYPAREAELDRALKGVLGMMRFGDYKSPVLLQALGDILIARARDAKQLAARAYLRASYEVKDEAVKKQYRDLARVILQLQTWGNGSTTEMTLDELEKMFKREIAEADAWYSRVEIDERQWLAKGLDLDVEFENEYYLAPEVEDQRTLIEKSGLTPAFAGGVLTFGFIGFLCSLLLVNILRGLRTRRQRQDAYRKGLS